MPTATTDVSDAYPQASVFDPIFRSFGGRQQFEGPIRTVRSFEDNVLVEEALETVDSGEILVVDGGGSGRCALVGDRLAQIAVDRDIPGLVIYGCVRDTAELVRLDVGVLALMAHPRRSRKDGAGERDCTLTLAGVMCSPGQYLYADHDGVLVTPHPVEIH